MKKVLLFVILTVVLSSFLGPKAAIEWSFMEYDFGQIERQKPASIEFVFKNPSMIPLMVVDVKSSCGCTVPDYPKEPIPPGGEGKIIVTFDAKLSGYFNKTITVTTNAATGVSHLYIKGEVN